MGMTAFIGAQLGATALDYILGGDPETMTPEQRQLYEYVWKELQKSDAALGFSRPEKAGMQKNLQTKLQEESQIHTTRSLKSLQRRRMLSPGQTAGITTGIGSAYGKAYGQGITDIDLASMQAGRQRKGQLLSMIPGLTGEMPQEPDLGGSMSNFISNLAYYYASKGKKNQYEDQPSRWPWG
jgi:hypothetical protein